MFRYFLALVALLGILSTTPARADNDDPLFVNLTSDEAHRADMAFVFSQSMQARGHPITIWLNDRGVLIVSRQNAEKFATEQKLLGELVAKGATVLVCPFCMKHYGVAEADLMDGARLGNPDLTSKLLFADDTQTLSW